MYFEALLTPVGQQDVAETLHLSRACVVVNFLFVSCRVCGVGLFLFVIQVNFTFFVLV